MELTTRFKGSFKENFSLEIQILSKVYYNVELISNDSKIILIMPIKEQEEETVDHFGSIYVSILGKNFQPVENLL